MRLITSKVYRAFPELDAFSDERCERFVRFTNHAWGPRLVQWTILGLASMIAVIAGFVAAVLGLQIVVLGREVRALALGAFLPLPSIILATTTWAIGLVLVLILRDVLMRRSVRRVIGRCGTCYSCLYPLLGMRVEDNLTITCPECGHVTEVDPALNELATNQAGEQVFVQDLPRVQTGQLTTRRARHRKLVVIGGLALLLPLLLVGPLIIWWYTLQRQAAFMRTMTAPETWRAELALTQPNPEGPNQLAEYIALSSSIVSRFTQAAEVNATSNQRLDRAGMICLSLICENAAAYRTASQRMTLNEDRVLARAVLMSLSQEGAFAALEQLAQIRHMVPERNASESSYESQQAIQQAQGLSSSLGAICAARMQLAAESQSWSEFETAYRDGLRVASVIELPGVWYALHTSNWIKGQLRTAILRNQAVIQDASSCRRLLNLSLELDQPSRLSRCVPSLRDVSIDAARAFFTEPSGVMMLGLFGRKYDPSNQQWGSTVPILGKVGSFEENQRSITARAKAWMDYFDNPQSTGNKPPTPPDALPLANDFELFLASLPSRSSAWAFERQSFLIRLALREHFLRTGAYPAALAELSDTLPPALLLDQTANKPMPYALEPDPEAPGGQRVLLGSEADPPLTGSVPRATPKR